MPHMLAIPHRKARGLCPVNGIRDLVHGSTGADWSNAFLYGLGQGGGFAYLRFGFADPPRQVYWGIAGPRQHAYLADLLGAGCKVIENRSFPFTWKKACAALEAGKAPLLGPLDMFHLRYYERIYHRRHVPIHYVLLVGHDGETAYVQDTDRDDVQAIPLEELRSAWDVNVPGLGKRNRMAVFEIPRKLPPVETLIRKSIADQSRTMLDPPVSMLGLPAMRKLAREIPRWPEELGEKATSACLRQVREFLNSPPDPAGDHLTAGRDLYVQFLREAAAATGWDLSGPIRRLRASVRVVPRLAGAIGRGELEEAAACVLRIAEEEAGAYTELSRIAA